MKSLRQSMAISDIDFDEFSKHCNFDKTITDKKIQDKILSAANGLSKLNLKPLFKKLPWN